MSTSLVPHASSALGGDDVQRAAVLRLCYSTALACKQNCQRASAKKAADARIGQPLTVCC